MHNFKSNFYLIIRENKGFSLIEAVVVLSILSTLSLISIPKILTSIKLNRIDEAKMLMDSYASECLEGFRLGNQLSTFSPQTFSEKKVNTLGYTKDPNSNCLKFSLNPLKSNNNLAFQIDFMIGPETGTLIKTATPSSESASLKSCEMWAGDLCSSSGGLKSNWESIFNTENNKIICESNFYNWKQSQPSGSSNTWDEFTQSCTKTLWVHKNYVADSESKYQKIKSNEECSASKKLFSTYTGEKYIPQCNQTYYFYNGIDMGSKDLMQVKLIEDQEASCKVKREEKRVSSPNGKQPGEALSGECGNSYWICNQKILTTLDQWKESDCFASL